MNNILVRSSRVKSKRDTIQIELRETKRSFLVHVMKLER